MEWKKSGVLFVERWSVFHSIQSGLMAGTNYLLIERWLFSSPPLYRRCIAFARRLDFVLLEDTQQFLRHAIRSWPNEMCFRIYFRSQSDE